MKARRYLFLQGVASPFFKKLAERLDADGQQVYRVNFCTGDLLYWGRNKAWQFRSDIAKLADFLHAKFAAHQITDVVLFGDQRPIHRVAAAVAEQHAARVHVFEEGYLRPNWFTLERDGVNAASSLPRQAQWYLQAARALPEQNRVVPVAGDIRVRAAHDMLYHVANLLNPLLYPGYRTHRPYNALIEYLGWARRFAQAPWYRRRDSAVITALCLGTRPFFVLPLQLNADYQIARHSKFGDMRDVIAQVVESFAQHASSDSLLVIKNHPLDTGLVDYTKALHRLGRRLTVDQRIRYLESGDLTPLINKAQGVITVNSTVGLAALLQDRPVCCLGDALYALPGLVHTGDLDSFWRQPLPPDQALAQAFRKVIIQHTQINGDLYTASGIQQAMRAVLDVLQSGPLPAGSG